MFTLDGLCLQNTIFRQQPTIHVQDQPRRLVAALEWDIYLLAQNTHLLKNKQTNKKHIHTHKHTQMARILTRLGIGKSGLLETHHSCLISKRMLFNNTWNPVVGKYSSHVPVMMIFLMLIVSHLYPHPMDTITMKQNAAQYLRGKYH